MASSSTSLAALEDHSKICVVCITSFAVDHCLLNDPVTIGTWNLALSEEKQSIIASHASKVKSAGIDVYSLKRAFVRDLQLPVSATLFHSNKGYLLASSKDGKSMRRIVHPIEPGSTQDYQICSTCYATPNHTPVSPKEFHFIPHQVGYAPPYPSTKSTLNFIERYLASNPPTADIEMLAKRLLRVLGSSNDPTNSPAPPQEHNLSSTSNDEEDLSAIFG